MPDYDRPHIDITPFLTAEGFRAHQSSGARTFARNRAQHGARLSEGLAASIAAAEARRPPIENLPAGIEAGEGTFVTVTLDPNAKELDLEKPAKGVRQSAAGQTLERRTMVLHLRDEDARNYISGRVERYWHGELTATGKPPLAGEMQPIEDFSATELLDLWREDPAALPSWDDPACWWGVWCWDVYVDDVVELVRAVGMQVAPEDRWSTFPDVKVVPIHATREQMQTMLNLAPLGVAEIGFATDDPAILVNLTGEEQDGLAEDLAGRITWPGAHVPAVCLLDTGVNRAHPLIEPALDQQDTQTIDPEWGVDDEDGPGHGTPMAGLALHGDLTGPLADSSTPELRHRLESVKVLAPNPSAQENPENYGAITQMAVALAETRNPTRARTICSAVTDRARIGDRPSRWSAAIDSIASGVDADTEEEPPRRLFVQAIGNVDHDNDWSLISDTTQHPGKDPAQAWNALTVGGVTFKNAIEPHHRSEWTACADVGQASPYGRTTCVWPDGTTPIKPEIVFEAGNRAKNAIGDQVSDAMPSLSLVSTGKGGTAGALVPFYATSAATAQAARMATQIMAAHPSYWPETVRALMIHSADYTEPMRAEFETAGGKTARSLLRRRFGYGMPDLQRSLASASDDLALVAQAHIQPFDRPQVSVRDPARRVGRVTFGQAHYYDLPWPTRILEELGNCPVRLKVTLSYFVEPYPLKGSMLDPASYRSFGLRFDLKRRQESESQFRRRRNAEMGEPVRDSEADPNWDFGPKAIAAGSVHSDTWSGRAVDLASRDRLAIFPVVGWWRDRQGQGRYLDKTRYALVITLEAPEAGIDLQAEVAATAEAMVASHAGITVEGST